MKIRKLVALFLAVVLALSMAACGGETETTTATEDQLAESQNPSEDTKAPDAEVDNFTMEEPCTVKIGVANSTDFTYFGGETAEKNAWTDLYAEHNIMVDVMYEVDVSQADAKLTNAIISASSRYLAPFSAIKFLRSARESPSRTSK